MDDLARDLAIAPVEPINGAAELTPSWLQGALRAAGYDVTITGLAVEPVGTGQLSVSLRARFDVAAEVSGLPRSVVVKIPAADEGLRSLMSPAYLSEIGFYHELSATVDVDVPACHLVTAAPDGSSFTLILEDMAPATPGDQISGATVAEVAQAIRNLAGLHAPRWGDPSLRESRWLRTQGEASNASLAEVYPLLLPQVAERLGAALSPEDHATLQEVATVLGAFFKARSHRYSLIHGDYRLDNLLFGPDGRVSVVDWQTLAVGLPARDLAYVIGTSLSAADRRAAEGDLVRGYWEDLLRQGVTGYSLAECFDDYRLGMLQCPFISVLGMAWGTPTDRGDAMFAAMISRSCQALRDLGSIALAAAEVLPQPPPGVSVVRRSKGHRRLVANSLAREPSFNFKLRHIGLFLGNGRPYRTYRAQKWSPAMKRCSPLYIWLADLVWSSTSVAGVTWEAGTRNGAVTGPGRG